MCSAEVYKKKKKWEKKKGFPPIVLFLVFVVSALAAISLKKELDWRCRSQVQHLGSMQKALSLMPNTENIEGLDYP